MGGMDLNLDPSIGLAKVILGLTLFVGMFQLIRHTIKGIKWIQSIIFANKETTQEINVTLNSSALDALTVKSDSILKLCAFYLTPVFRNILAIMYFLSILIVVLKGSIFTDKVFDFDNYLAGFEYLLGIQFFIICLAYLLWSYATHKMRRLIPWGLFIISVDVVIEVISQYFQYPFYHWVQLAELLLSGLALLIIPGTGFLIFNYIFKLQKEK